MTESSEPAPPIPAEPPPPPGQQHVEAPELRFDPPDEAEVPDATAVSEEAGLVEPPD